MISRRYICLNTMCRHEFDSFDEGGARCPECGNLRIKELPPRVNIKTNRTTRSDSIYKDLVDSYGLTNSHSEEGLPNVRPPPDDGPKLNVHTPMGELPLSAAQKPTGTWGALGMTSGLKVEIPK